ncbi:GrpB family protein [Nocardia acididurans]|nr:GrpB family protein [Nocardia acididurans]
MDSNEIEAATVGELKPYGVRVVVEDYNPDWPHWFTEEATAIRAALPGRILLLEHTGSTSVPGLAAKPIIDMLLVIPDAATESTYLPALEQLGYTLRVREPDWYQHRCLIRRTETGAPRSVNLHIFPPGAADPEITRILTFRDWLRTHPDDRDRYERVKRELAQQDWRYVQDYANAKSPVIEEILTRALHPER